MSDEQKFNLLNRLDSIKTKISDQEYRQFAEEIGSIPAQNNKLLYYQCIFPKLEFEKHFHHFEDEDTEDDEEIEPKVDLVYFTLIFRKEDELEYPINVIFHPHVCQLRKALNFVDFTNHVLGSIDPDLHRSNAMFIMKKEEK
jgi:hypothetical protein